MDIRIAQGCPQCGATVPFSEDDQLLTCPYCATCNVVQSQGPSRFALPLPASVLHEGLLFAPYLRFKGTIYLVSDAGIEHRVIDTTQAANPMPGLPPSLGLRPQAMGVCRLEGQAEHRYLPQTLRANAILEKAVAIADLSPGTASGLYHRAYIGESLSYIYLPLAIESGMLVDVITTSSLVSLEEAADSIVQGRGFESAWAVRFNAALCPHCGATLSGERDSRVLPCANCHHAWSVGAEGLQRVDWHLQPGSAETALYLPFWKITAHIPALSIYSFADFIERSNQPLLPRPRWRERAMSLWVPAVKLRPKIFLQAGRQATLGQWLLKPEQGQVVKHLHPVTLPATEARQAAKLMLAATTASPKRIFPYLPQVRLTETMQQLVYLPCLDNGHDWVQPETNITIPKNILRFGRSL